MTFRPNLPCRHCGTVRPVHGRGLCQPCYQDPDIRQQHKPYKRYVSEGAPCRNCRLKPASRCRGLCWSCYEDRTIRDRYPSESKFAHTAARGQVGIIDFCGPAAEAEPTAARPGTPEKLAVLCRRAELGQGLFAAGDGPVDLE